MTSGLQPTRATLDNGLVVLAKETRKTRAVTIHLAVRSGSICDPHAASGATYLLAQTIDRGTATRSTEAIAEELDGRGISLAINVTRHLFSIACTCLARDFEAVLTLLGDMLMAPVLPPRELAVRKGEVVTSLRQDEDNPAVRAVERLMALLYGEEHPYGRPTKGTIEVIERLSRDQLLLLHAERFRPSELIVIVVGDVGESRVFEAAGRIFGGWHAPRPSSVGLPPVVRPDGRRRRVIPMMNKSQADIAYGFTTVKRSDPAYYAYWIMNVALGQYAIGGRLGDSIRERQGMAYYVSSVLDANVLEGPLMIRAGVSPTNVDRAIRSIDAELTRLRSDGLSERELTETRAYLIGSMPRGLETNAGIASFLQSVEWFGLGLDYDRRLPDLLGAVTLADVHAATRALDPERATVVIAGPYEE